MLLKDKLREIVETLIDQKNIDKIPAEIRIIASYFAEFSKEHAPKQMWALVGGLLLLRYINPALTTPESFGLLPEGKVPSPIPRRNLVLISKAIQVSLQLIIVFFIMIFFIIHFVNEISLN